MGLLARFKGSDLPPILKIPMARYLFTVIYSDDGQPGYKQRLSAFKADFAALEPALIAEHYDAACDALRAINAQNEAFGLTPRLSKEMSQQLALLKLLGYLGVERGVTLPTPREVALKQEAFGPRPELPPLSEPALAARVEDDSSLDLRSS
jgi:hypothetical protein